MSTSQGATPQVTTPQDHRYLFWHAITALAALIAGLATGATAAWNIYSSRPEENKARHLQAQPAAYDVDRFLRESIPESIRPQCRKRMQLPEGGIVGVDCAPVSGLSSANYVKMNNGLMLKEMFDSTPSGACSGHEEPGGIYYEGTVAAGRVKCYVWDGKSFIEWTREDDVVWALARHDNDAALEALYNWWSSGAGGPLLSEYLQLLTRVPSELQPYCTESSDTPKNALVKVTCSTASADVDRVSVALFDSEQELEDFYDLRPEDVSFNGEDCSSGGSRETVWRQRGTLVPSGKLRCYQSDDSWYLEWTDDDKMIWALAVREDEDFDVLYNWWVDVF